MRSIMPPTGFRMLDSYLEGGIRAGELVCFSTSRFSREGTMKISISNHIVKRHCENGEQSYILRNTMRENNDETT